MLNFMHAYIKSEQLLFFTQNEEIFDLFIWFTDADRIYIQKGMLTHWKYYLYIYNKQRITSIQERNLFTFYFYIQYKILTILY